jgi:uncharacterized integral membrane protein
MKNLNYGKLAAIVVLLAMLVAVIVQNRAPAQIQFLLVTIEMPLILLLALTACGGFALGMLVALLTRSRTQRAGG